MFRHTLLRVLYALKFRGRDRLIGGIARSFISPYVDLDDGLRMELDALHDDHRSFMRSWEAVDDAELVVVDPELLKVPDRPWWETFDPCGECAPTVSNWPADAGFAERAISLCGPCYTVYKDLKQAPSKDRPPPQRVSPYVLALDRSLVPLNAEMAKMDVVRVSHKGYPAVLLFSFH